MAENVYLIAAVLIGGAITLALRALPFALLKPLRKSKLVQRLGQWMPVGILCILAVTVLFEQATAAPQRIIPVILASAVTVLVHLSCKRRALLSIFAGTGCYIWLVNAVFVG